MEEKLLGELSRKRSDRALRSLLDEKGPSELSRYLAEYTKEKYGANVAEMIATSLVEEIKR